jgi:hypothetical protein
MRLDDFLSAWCEQLDALEADVVELRIASRQACSE